MVISLMSSRLIKEVMVEPPVALSAHFVHDKRAKVFIVALKKTLKQTLPKSPVVDMFLESIEVQDEATEELKVKSWNILKEVRNISK